MSRDELARLLRSEGLPRPDDFAALAIPCVVLATRRATRQPATRTRIGGAPDLRRGRPWPLSSHGSPLTFFGQIDLAELAKTAIAGELPAAGLLGCFYVPGSDGPPEFAMTFTVDDDVIDRAEPPAYAFPTCEVKMMPAWSLPAGGFECPFVGSLDLTKQEADDYADFRSLWEGDHMPRGHRLLGYATAPNDPYVGAALDTDPELRAEWFARPPQDRLRLTAALAAAARSFRLLIDFCDDEQAGMDGLDGARLSFFLRREAWARGAFDQRTPTREAATWCERS